MCVIFIFVQKLYKKRARDVYADVTLKGLGKYLLLCVHFRDLCVRSACVCVCVCVCVCCFVVRHSACTNP